MKKKPDERVIKIHQSLQHLRNLKDKNRSRSLFDPSHSDKVNFVAMHASIVCIFE